MSRERAEDLRALMNRHMGKKIWDWKQYPTFVIPELIPFSALSATDPSAPAVSRLEFRREETVWNSGGRQWPATRIICEGLIIEGGYFDNGLYVPLEGEIGKAA